MTRDVGTGEELAGGSELATSPDLAGGGRSYAAREYSVVRADSFRSRTILTAAAVGLGSGATRLSAMWGRLCAHHTVHFDAEHIIPGG